MISVITIVLFLLYLWGFGFTATYYLKKSDNLLERNLMNLGLGLGIFSIISIILNFFRIPLDWKIFLLLSLVFPLCVVFKNYKSNNLKFPKISLTKSNLIILIVLVIFSLSLFMYAKGSFSYPYLENEDPWGHSVGVKYVSVEKSAYDPPLVEYEANMVLTYMDPYPPAYDVLLGVLHQTSSDLRWTIKFFNALIISLGLIFFFFFVKLFTNNRNKALLATFILAAIPSYLSHFIWAHSLVITLFFPTMYAFEMIKVDKRWWVVASFMVAGIWVAQNLSQPIKLTTMILIYLIVVSIVIKKFWVKGFSALFGGLLLSQFWWMAMVKKYTLKGFMIISGGEKTGSSIGSSTSSIFTKITSLVKSITSPGGSGSRSYHFDDFFIAKSQNMINNPIGLGIVVTVLSLIGLFYVLWKYKSSIVQEKNSWLCVVLFWLIFTFWGVNGQTFPISVARGPFRVWMLLSIPIAIIAAEGIFFIKNLVRNKTVRNVIIAALIIGIISTSAIAKYELNTTIWPTSSALNSPQEAFEYAKWFDSIPDESKVLMYTSRQKIVTGFGKQSCNWCQEELDHWKSVVDKDAKEVHKFMKERKYEYLIASFKNDFKYFKKNLGDEKKAEKLLNQKYQEIANSGLFEPVYHVENVFIVFKVK